MEVADPRFPAGMRLGRRARKLLLMLFGLVQASAGPGFPAQSEAPALLRGPVTDPLLGISFQIPSGWLGQKIPAGYLLASPESKSVIFLLPNNSIDPAALQREAAEGLNDGQGTLLRLDGEVQAWGDRGVQAAYQGTIQGQAARSFAIGMLSPHGGGITIFIVAPAAGYDSEYSKLARELAASLKFLPPATKAAGEEWKNRLAGRKLTYLSSYSSGSSGGMSTQRFISLCSSGKFRLSGNSLVAMDVGGAFGNSGGRENAEGTWTVESTAGQAILVLRQNDGEIRRFEVSMQEGKLFLDGRRYFQTEDPDCPF